MLNRRVTFGVITACAALYACGESEPRAAREAGGSCPAEYKRGGHSYYRWSRGTHLLKFTPDRRVDVWAVCPRRERVTAWTVRELPPRVALLLNRASDDPYVAPGSFPVDPAHPLHATIAPVQPPDLAQGNRCRSRPPGPKLRVHEVGTFGGLLVLRAGGKEQTFRADSKTRFGGFEGMPILDRGDIVAVKALDCEGSGRPLLRVIRLVARS